MKRVASACDMATDCGCRPPYLDMLAYDLGEAIKELQLLRADLCRITDRKLMQIKETAGSDAGGKERQRSRTMKDEAGESRQTTRRRK